MVNWYNLKLDERSKNNKLFELINRKGKYGKRHEIEPILNRLYKNERERKKLLKTIKYDIETFRSSFSKENNEAMVYLCNSLLNKLDSNE